MTVVKYRAVADAIRADIEAGRLKPGETLPGIRTLMLAHGESQGTVAAAVRFLAAEGWLIVEHGRPTVVTSPGPTLAERVARLEDRVTRLEERP